ncbi:MAG TPA: hypothetical protein PKC99_11670 [Anaerolineales bacterium]|jgi:hypothetical protein|nr:hypothetical protein [Anaerolineae bacterium]MBL1172082.1 hypothetical protein [Chloroflexota bacterium]MBV6465065.1 hypothetical protein [Anaerolineales bacterium]MDL1927005.1 hypothetical protein [Anaerolineae bacterium AMX1]OQY80875.1 MAG: hypothetical protein B6D40_12040 [Anaerolineae bacterium UTCFX3]
MRFNWRLVLAAIFLLVSIPLLIWGFWPPRRETATVPLVTPAGAPSLPGRTARLTYSPSMRAGDSQVARLDVSADGDLPPGYDVVAEARLDFPLAEARPAELVSAALTEGHGATFYWEAKPRETRTSSGTLWLYLRFVPKAGGEETRQPVWAERVEIRSTSLLGRTGSEARAAGAAGTLAGLVILLWARSAKQNRA